MAVGRCRSCGGLAILVSIFRNLGSITIDKKKKRINGNEYQYSFSFSSCPFLGFLINVFLVKP
jgi:hypothetical protein